MAEIFRAAQLAEYLNPVFQAYQEKELARQREASLPKVKVSQALSSLALVYEKVRTAVDFRAEHLFRSAFPCTPCEVRVFSPPEDVEQRDWVAPDILILDAAVSGADAVRWLAQAHSGPADRAGDRVSPLVLLAGDWPEQGNNRPWFAEVRTVACKALSQESSLLECLRELRITPTSQVARPATPPTEVLSHD